VYIPYRCVVKNNNIHMFLVRIKLFTMNSYAAENHKFSVSVDW